MLIKLFGFFDILAGISLWLSAIIPFPSIILGLFGVYLIGKGLAFVGFGLDLLSMIDIVSGIVFIVSVSSETPLQLISMISIYLLGKGAMSLAT